METSAHMGKFWVTDCRTVGELTREKNKNGVCVKVVEPDTTVKVSVKVFTFRRSKKPFCCAEHFTVYVAMLHPPPRLRNDLDCVGWGVKLYSLTHSLTHASRVWTGIPIRTRLTPPIPVPFHLLVVSFPVHVISYNSETWQFVRPCFTAFTSRC